MTDHAANPFDLNENRDANVLYMHMAFAESCLRRGKNLDEYAGVVLQNKALEHLQSGMRVVQPEWKDSHRV